MANKSLERPPGPSPVRTIAKLGTGNVGVTDFMVGLIRDYPEISHTNLGLEHVYALGSAELIREMFVTHSHDVNKAPALKNSNDLLNNGLLTNEGESWKRQRRLVQPGFHQGRIREYADQMAAISIALHDSWQEGQSVDLAADMSATTLRIVGSALFGDDFDDAHELGASLNNVMAGSSRWLLPFGQVLGRIPTPANRRAKEGSQKLQAAVKRLIAARRSSGDTGDVLSMLLAAHDDETNTSMSDQQVQDEVMTIILAGHETTAMTLSWAWMILHDRPEIADQVRAEIDSVLTNSRPATFDDLLALPLCRGVIAESLRLYPPAWIMGRKVTNDFELGRWTLPVGSTVVCCPLATHRDARYWDRPEEFLPTRWLTDAGTFDDEAPGQPSGAWLPFGLGLRKCVGQSFAWMESVIVLATLAQHWNPEVTVSRPLQLTPAITLRPRDGMPAVLHRR